MFGLILMTSREWVNGGAIIQSLPRTDRISRSVLQANSVASTISLRRMLWITICSMVSTLAAKCGTRAMILFHSSTFPTKKSFDSSPSRSVRRADDTPDFPSLWLSLSSDSSSDLRERMEALRVLAGGCGGLGSMREVICCSFWAAFLRRLRMRARTILKVSSRKAVVLQKSQNSWQQRSRKFSQELGLAIFFSPRSAAFSDSTSALSGSSFSKADRSGASSSSTTLTKGRRLSTSSMSCWLTWQSLAKTCSMRARRSLQKRRQMASKSEQARGAPSWRCLFWTVLRSFSRVAQRRLARYSRRKPAMRSKLISRRMWISSSVSRWNCSSPALYLLISLMQQWSMRCVRSPGTSTPSPERNSSANSQIFRSGSLKMSSQGSGGRKWQPLGLSASLARQRRARRTKQYQQRWVPKKTASRSSWRLRPRTPAHPHSRWNSQKRLWVVRSSRRLYWRFLRKSCATFLHPVRTTNHSSTNPSTLATATRDRTDSQSPSSLSTATTLNTLPATSFPNENGVTTFSRNSAVAPLAPARVSTPLLVESRKTWAAASALVGRLRLHSPICSFSRPTSSASCSFSSSRAALACSSCAMRATWRVCRFSWNCTMLESRSFLIWSCACSRSPQRRSQSSCRGSKLLLRPSSSWQRVRSFSTAASCVLRRRSSFWQAAKQASACSRKWRVGRSFSQSSDLRELRLAVKSSRQRARRSFILACEQANLGSQISSSFPDSSSSTVSCASTRSSGILRRMSGRMPSRSEKARVDSRRSRPVMALRSSLGMEEYSFSRNSLSRSCSQLPRWITFFTKFCNFFSARYCCSSALQSLFRNCTKDFVNGRSKCRCSSPCVASSRSDA